MNKILIPVVLLIAALNANVYPSNCKYCHGDYGERAVSGAQKPLMDYEQEDLLENLKYYRDGGGDTISERDMHRKLRYKSDEELLDIAKYLTGFTF